MPGQLHPAKTTAQLLLLIQIKEAFSRPQPWFPPPAPGDLEDFLVEE